MVMMMRRSRDESLKRNFLIRSHKFFPWMRTRCIVSDDGILIKSIHYCLAFRGTLTPFFRALDKAIAIACLRDFTGTLAFPLLSFPALNLLIAERT